MSTYFSFYKPQYNPTGMVGTVGGAISSTQLLPRKDTLFASRDTSELIAVSQYRKFYAKQVADVTLTGVKVEIANVDMSSQIYFGVTTGTNDYVTDPTIAPTGVDLTGNYLYPVYLTGSYTLNSTIPIWVKQVISANTSDDDFVSFQLRIVGTLV